MAATDQKLTNCVAYYRKKLDARPQPPESLSQAPDGQLHRIVELAGAQRRSDLLLNRLDQAFKDAGIITYPNLADPGLEPDDRVFMIDARHPIEGLAPTSELFRNEAALQNFIWTNRYQLTDFQNLGLRNFRQQVTLDSGRRVDLLCERRGLKQLVGIELKVRQPDDRAVGQLQQYLDDLDAHAKSRDYDSAHLILIAGQPDKSVRNRVVQYATTRGLTVTFLLYRVKLDLHAQP